MIQHVGKVLRDSYGRIADDLRISVTDRCNFRCVYCMPAEGLRWLAREDILRFEEIHRLARLSIERFKDIARVDAFRKVMDGLRAAEEAGLNPIKLNMVVMRGHNDDEVVDF